MRYISHIRNFAVGIMSKRVEYLPGGIERVIVPELTARFKVHDVTAEELEFAERVWRKLPGQTYEADEVTPTARISRLSTFDTESPENQALFREVDDHMIKEGLTLPGTRDPWKVGDAQRITEAKLADRAVRSETFAIVAERELAPPWPLYDAFPGEPEDLVAVVVSQGHNVRAVLAYEEQHQDRPSVVSLLREEVAKFDEATGAPATEFVAS